MNITLEESSFRDPSGFLYYQDGEIYRQINKEYSENYNLLMSSGLYSKLVEQELLIPHTEVEGSPRNNNCYKIIKPENLNFISYPYEWCFSQLKDAAITTLKILKLAMEHGMSLKDSSAYNIQFRKGKPILIDTLSFEKYNEGSPWVAYKQFCQHFLAPLTLMSYKDIRLGQLFKIYIDGVPLDLASSLLPTKTYLKFSILANIHLNAKSQKKYENQIVDTKKYKISYKNLLSLIDSLEDTVNKLTWKLEGTEWGDYYSFTNYTNDSFDHKKLLVNKFIEQSNPNALWDLGANTGEFSRIASSKGISTIAFDIDPVAVEKNYLYSVEKKEENILPLLLDLTNPSPSIGWDNEERVSLKNRKHPDTVLALALIHHLAISNNVPLNKIAKFFANICNNLIIEFVPKSDSQVKKLLATRKDIFDTYNQENFEICFKNYFEIIASEKIKESERTLYLLQKNSSQTF